MSWNVTRHRIAKSKSEATKNHGDYREYLRAELTRRKALSPHYSLRDFAKQIGVSPSQLSRVLKGQRGLSRKSAAKVLSAMGVKGNLATRFVWQVAAQSGRSAYTRAGGLLALRRKLIVNAKKEQERFCKLSSVWSDQVWHFNRFAQGIDLKLRRELFHRANSCALIISRSF